MTALEELPADQRAVLELVLKRGRSYDEIARLLRIDRAGVRQRALAAFDALGPRTSVGPERRALITDYLLGALPPRVSEDVRARLAREWAARAWARVIASELATVASDPLPEIPVWHEDLELDGELPQSGGAERYATDTGEMPVAVVEPPDTAAPPRDDETPDEPDQDETPDEADHEEAGARTATAEAVDEGEREREREGEDEGILAPARPARSSRVGGAIILGILAVALVVVVIVLIANSGGSSKKSASASTPATTTGATTAGTPPILAQVTLTPPNASSKARGIGEAFKQSGREYLAIIALNLAPNNHNYYAVWLSNGPNDSRLLGFANPGVASNGRLQAATPLQSGDSRFKQLLLTVETQGHPKTPGTVVLSGPIHLPSS